MNTYTNANTETDTDTDTGIDPAVGLINAVLIAFVIWLVFGIIVKAIFSFALTLY